MKTLNETFTDDEFDRLVIAKKKIGLNWHEFIMTLVENDEVQEE
jgi:hypothetical protein